VIQPDALRLGDVHRVSWIDSFRLFFKIPHWGNIPAPPPDRPLWGPCRILVDETTLGRGLFPGDREFGEWLRSSNLEEGMHPADQSAAMWAAVVPSPHPRG